MQNEKNKLPNWLIVGTWIAVVFLLGILFGLFAIPAKAENFSVNQTNSSGIIDDLGNVSLQDAQTAVNFLGKLKTSFANLTNPTTNTLLLLAFLILVALGGYFLWVQMGVLGAIIFAGFIVAMFLFRHIFG